VFFKYEVYIAQVWSSCQIQLSQYVSCSMIGWKFSHMSIECFHVWPSHMGRSCSICLHPQWMKEKSHGIHCQFDYSTSIGWSFFVPFNIEMWNNYQTNQTNISSIIDYKNCCKAYHSFYFSKIYFNTIKGTKFLC
jgi:hypothetical protein